MKYFSTPWIAVISLCGAILVHPIRADAQSKADYDELKAELRALQSRTVQLERRLAVAEARPMPANPDKSIIESDQPIVRADETGFGVRSRDGRFSVQLGGYLQVDSRFFNESDRSDKRTDTFLLRRVRPILEGTLYKDFHFFVMPDFGEGKVVLQDSFIEYTRYTGAQFRVGKFREPVGLEMLQSAKDLLFVERGLPTNIVPIRDVGAMLSGVFFDGALNYQLGVFNGVRDGASGDIDTNDDKDVAARLWIMPWKLSQIPVLHGFGVGIAGTYGQETGLPAEYKTPAQQVCFDYKSDVVADGDRYRVVPQFYYSFGPLGVLGEYALSNSEVSNATTQAHIDSRAWQIAASYVITGENASWKGVKPRNNFGESGMGAWELAARYGELEVDQDAFQLGLADRKTSIQGEKSFEVGLNWYLNPHVKAVLDWEHTVFSGGALTGNRESEDAILTRVQLAL